MTRVAIVHDYLTQRGGAERVVLAMARAFPDAPVHTSLYEPAGTFPEFADVDVRPLALNRIGALRRDHRRALPLLAAAFSRLRIEADVVLCSSSGWAHGVAASGRKVVYCHNPARWLYQREQYTRSGTPARAVARALARPLRAWDARAARSADRYIVNSSVVRRRVAAAYGLAADVLPPPVGIDPDGPVRAVEGCAPGAFLCVSRLLPYKNVGAVAEAFALLPSERLVIVGTGPEHARLQAAAPPNVSLVGRVGDAELRWLYATCRGLVGASFEDFGLTPLEAGLFGRPAAVLRDGGYLDTVIEGRTGTFFQHPRPGDIADAVERLRRARWDAAAISRHAAQFGEDRFAARLREMVLHGDGSDSEEASAVTGHPPGTVDHGPLHGASHRTRPPADTPAVSVDVVVPTRNRPDRLARCLASLAEARRLSDFSIVVCDSSDESHRAEVERIVRSTPAARVHLHSGRNVAAARNACVRAATADLLVNVDDDVYVEPTAIRDLVEAYLRGRDLRVVAGSVRWGDEWSRPVVMRRIGWGRWALPGERPSFLVGAFFAYPRVMGQAWPWNERIRVSDDRFMGALWRGKGVALEFAPQAKAVHDERHVRYGVDDQESHVYANMFDALVAEPNLARAICYQVLGFMSGAKAFARSPAGARDFVSAWTRGSARFVRDLPRLREMAARPLPSASWESPALSHDRTVPGRSSGRGMVFPNP